MIEKSFTRYIIQKHFIELFMRLHIFSVGRKVCHTKHVVLRFAVDDLRIKKFKKTTSFLNRKLILLEKMLTDRVYYPGNSRKLTTKF